MNEKLLRANYTVLAAYPEYAADPFAPTAAELNAQFVWDTNESAMVFNWSCGIQDDSNNINQASSDTDSTMSICDLAETETPTFQNYEVTIDAFRDLDIDGKGVFNLIRNMTLTADRPLIIITRIGANQKDPFVAGEVISIFGVTTDNPVEIAEDNAPLGHGARFKPTGSFKINTEVAA